MAHLIFYLLSSCAAWFINGAAAAAALPADGEDPGEQLFALPFAKLFLSEHGELVGRLNRSSHSTCPSGSRYRTPPPNTSPERLDR